MSWQSAKNLFPVAWETMSPSISDFPSVFCPVTRLTQTWCATSVDVMFLTPVSHPLVTAVLIASSHKQFLPSFPRWHFLCQKRTHQTQSPLPNVSTGLLFFGLLSPEINFTPSFRILLIKFNYWNIFMNTKKKLVKNAARKFQVRR